ncbi:MAG TPA: SDR family oxidoreductase [Candidatus Angelobacter sp.]|jgi:short-subunit dehydrogenase
MNRSSFVITGASSDLGSALAQYLDSTSNADLVLTSRSKDRMPKLGRKHVQLSGIDLTQPKCLRTLKQQVGKRFSGPFTIVHCVGDFWRHKPLVKTKFEEISGMISSHYLSLCGVAHALLPLLISRGGGRLVALSCNSVAYNYPDMAPFTAAKAAVESLIRCIANEYSEFNIVANAIALPTVRTAKVIEMKKTGDPESYVTPEEVVKVITETLAAASPVLNGNTLRIFRYSSTFFHEGYFQRNPREIQIVSL